MRRCLLFLVCAAATAGTVLAVLRPLTGVDWLNCLTTAVRIDGAEAPGFLSPRYYLTTRLMGFLDFLVLAGLGTAPFWMTLLVRRTAGADPGVARLVSLGRAGSAAAALFLLAGAYKIGETGRIFLFLLPLVVVPVVGAAGLTRAEHAGASPASRGAVAALVVIGFLQALLMEWFLDTRW